MLLMIISLYTLNYLFWTNFDNSVPPHHRRRMKREAKAKVVASVWGAEFVQFLAALVVLPR